VAIPRRNGNGSISSAAGSGVPAGAAVYFLYKRVQQEEAARGTCSGAGAPVLPARRCGSEELRRPGRRHRHRRVPAEKE